MIIGIGTDIIEIERIKKSLENRDAFLKKLFSKIEIENLEKRKYRPEFVAGKFAAKEAVAKALGTGFRDFQFKDIVIENNALGKPVVSLFGKAAIIAEKNGQYKMHLSISHSETHAIAYAILEGV
ncbi:holo-[acyl-carrier-protein] synthase [Hathewaya proteolytica DSM 3090]|uniref:Holo-[acyl-carrier-protein] synthase n=1 Tax=Hathewaya proteolytica DSM 3090 TaxID=1121331 RepID=A0A1M6NEB1_9CLOT|nr:holo-ACP synthase [Hathewaya proteolytica]SHJ94071.1 holo-[acyl-carrier-protein] synthase [Hathewaya proteolytica DSM 3090]